MAGLKQVLASDDVLVLASVASPVEARLIDEWLLRKRHEDPDRRVELLRLPRNEPTPGVIAQVANRLSKGGAKTVMPVRVMWKPVA